MPGETSGAVGLQMRAEGGKRTFSYSLHPGFPDTGEEVAEEQLKMNTGVSAHPRKVLRPFTIL